MSKLPPLTGEQEQEWAKQEQAFAVERLGESTAEGDHSYRLLTRALREPLPVALPPGFAAAVAQYVEREMLLDARWERRGIALLLLLFVLVAAGSVIAYGQSWLAGLQAALPSLPRLFNGWSLLLLIGLAFAYWPMPQPRR
ncbi:MAG: hypothetical protein JNN30_01430 [Rhodanobacteraceae bacterium]|nr:hypothetical protein [Rhodanobacteraceae bacterium]